MADFHQGVISTLHDLSNKSTEKLENFSLKLLKTPVLKRLKTASYDKLNEEASQLVISIWLYVDPDYLVKK